MEGTLSRPLSWGDGLPRTLNERLIGWYCYEGTWVYDRAKRRLVTLPVADHTAQTWVGGRLLVWFSAGTISVLDTTTLPA